MDDDAAKIKGATADTYTPVADDGDACLLVMAEYVDGFYEATALFDKSVSLPLAGKVQGSSDNMPPKFPGATTMRYVPEVEQAPADYKVGKPVTAKDPDGNTLGYTLGGADAGSFDIDVSNGQIIVSADVELDHETKPSHRVTVTATDPRGETDSITVTIHITDVDEAPKVTDPVKVIPYPENGTDAVATFTAVDPEGASPIVWSLPDITTEITEPVTYRRRRRRRQPPPVQDQPERRARIQDSARLRGGQWHGRGESTQGSRPGLRRRHDGDPQLVQGNRERWGRGRGRVGETEPDRLDSTSLRPASHCCSPRLGWK